jgi:hypothetical protein
MQHTKDFSKATIGSLKTRGIRIVGSTIVPMNGSTAQGQVVYNLDLRGTHYVRTHEQVLQLANNPAVTLEVK